MNVIGTIVAWGLMLLTLLENPFASTLMFDNLQGNNFVQVCASAALVSHRSCVPWLHLRRISAFCSSL